MNERRAVMRAIDEAYAKVGGECGEMGEVGGEGGAWRSEEGAGPSDGWLGWKAEVGATWDCCG